MMNTSCLIMAGGSGTRFWPRSTVARPKQYHSIGGKETLIQATMTRFAGLIPEDRIYIVSSAGQKAVLEEQAGNLPDRNLIFEPVGRNTLPAIGLASMVIAENDPDGILVVSPADHHVPDPEFFRRTVASAIQVAAETDGIVTIGISPSFPATGYGYVRTGKEVHCGQPIQGWSVRQFVEKPALAVAENYLRVGGYFWNSGIFVFKIKVFLDAVRKFAPDIYDTLLQIRKVVNQGGDASLADALYHGIEPVSIDYGILEKADNVYLVRGDFPWNDLGNWEEVYKNSPRDENNNAASGEVILVDTRNSYVSSTDGVVAVVGLEDVIVVQEGNRVLVCRRQDSEKVKDAVLQIRDKGLSQYL